MKNRVNMEKKYYSVMEYADQLGISPLTVRLWIRDKKIVAIKNPGGRAWQIPASELVPDLEAKK